MPTYYFTSYGWTSSARRLDIIAVLFGVPLLTPPAHHLLRVGFLLVGRRMLKHPVGAEKVAEVLDQREAEPA